MHKKWKRFFVEQIISAPVLTPQHPKFPLLSFFSSVNKTSTFSSLLHQTGRRFHLHCWPSPLAFFLLTLTDILSSINILPLCPFSHWHLIFFLLSTFTFASTEFLSVCIFFHCRNPYFSHELPSSMPMQASGSGCVVCWMGLGGREKEREVGRGGEREDTD